MTCLFPKPEHCDCQICGATHGLKSRPGLEPCCDFCWRRFQRHLIDFGLGQSAETFNGWLAKELMLAVERKEKRGIMGRCEAVNIKERLGFRMGGQCCRWATHRRNGRFVCVRHSGIKAVTFVGTPKHSEYRRIENLVVRVARVDAGLKAMILRSAKRLSASRRTD